MMMIKKIGDQKRRRALFPPTPCPGPQQARQGRLVPGCRWCSGCCPPWWAGADGADGSDGLGADIDSMTVAMAREPATERTDEELYVICQYGLGVSRMFARLVDATAEARDGLVEVADLWPHVWTALAGLAQALGCPAPEVSDRFEAMRRAWYDLAREVPPVIQLDWYADADVALCRFEQWVHVHGDPGAWWHRVADLAAVLDGLGPGSGWYEVLEVGSDVRALARLLEVKPWCDPPDGDLCALTRWPAWGDLYAALPEALAERLNWGVAMLRLRVDPESFDSFV